MTAGILLVAVLGLVPAWTPDDWTGEYFVSDAGVTVAVATVELAPVVDCDRLEVTYPTERWTSPVGEDGAPTGDWSVEVVSFSDSVTISDGPVRDESAMCPMWHLDADGSMWRDDVPAPVPVPVEAAGPVLKVGLWVAPKVLS